LAIADGNFHRQAAKKRQGRQANRREDKKIKTHYANKFKTSPIVFKFLGVLGVSLRLGGFSSFVIS